MPGGVLERTNKRYIIIMNMNETTSAMQCVTHVCCHVIVIYLETMIQCDCDTIFGIALHAIPCKCCINFLNASFTWQ